MIDPCSMPIKGKQTERNCSHCGKQYRESRKRKRPRQSLMHQVRNGNAIGDGVAEIAGQYPAQPVRILNDQRLIQPQLRAKLRDKLRVSGNAHQDKVKRDRVDGRELHEHECPAGHGEQHDHHTDEPP